MFPVPSGAINAAAQQYGEVKQAQDDKLHRQDHPEEAQAEENRKEAARGEKPTQPNGAGAPAADGAGKAKAGGEEGSDDAVGTKELLKAVHGSALTHM